ncbi:MAG: DegP-type protease [Monoraphidium minutum]|nr:MAG: DegP-type protease [Monoraphidium minutum]
MEEEVLTPDDASGLDDDAGAPPPRPPSAQPQPLSVPVRAAKRDWALRSVIKVFVVKVDPSYAQPWQKLPQRSSSGSAFVLDVERRLIITNAHVVANATTVYVRRPGDPKKTKATTACIARQCDLALLTVADDVFWEGLKPLKFVTETPELQSPVLVAGYPVGGDSLSITKGIVSRVCMTRYSQAGRLASLQIDAAINPGNSGGPAFSDMRTGLVAGVAFSKNVGTGTDNIGYIIPSLVVQHFLDEYRQRGTYRGLCSPGFYSQPLESPAQQHYLKVPPGKSGCIVVKLEPSSDAARVLELNDVVMEVDGVPIAGDETVPFRDDERLDYSHVINMKHVDETLRVKLLRAGEVMEAEYTLSRQHPLVGILHEVDCWPSYFIVGGLVFAPLSLPVLEAAYSARKWRTLAPVSVLAAFQRQRTTPEEQVVILVQVLSHEINHGYKLGMVPVETFNGAPISNLGDLAAAVDGNGELFLNFGLEGGRWVTLDAAQVKAQGEDVLRINGIARDRSDDLLGGAGLSTAGDAAAAAGGGAAAAAAAAGAGEQRQEGAAQPEEGQQQHAQQQQQQQQQQASGGAG